ncbi:MAG: 50S ribosomal protein L11 methyltransferase [Burkholderiaceae bacterium]|nr:50S ribosomal protein L11 methyltransferase [Burkholderiaceae bacterium]
MFELSLMCPEDVIEAVSDALDALDALSVSVEDADAQTDAEQALFGEPGMPPPKDGWQRSRVVALFATEAQAQEAQQLLALQDFFAACQVLGLTPLADQDWVRLTQSQFAPVDITPDFWIVPTWHALPAQALRSIRLDPGLAFGTGTHPTTRMCLRWIARQGEGPAAAQALGRVLDYGCGSGILAIGAAKFGAVDIDAVDIDPAAVESTGQNAQANGVQLHAGLPDKAQGLYQTVLANILATPLRVLAPLLCAHVAPGGHLVLAGILERQAQELKEAYAPWLALEVADTEDGWILMTAQR